MTFDALTSAKQPARTEARLTGLAAGTMVATMAGEVAVERLAVGMTVFTRDSGPVRIASVAHEIGGKERTAVRIAAGALGDGCPVRDITVADTHRVLLTSDKMMLLFNVGEALVAAGDLVGRPGITRVPAPALGWVSLALTSGDMVLTEGVWSEGEPMRLAGGVAAPSHRRVLSRIEAQLAG
ncbi:hypothetical protein PARPLA_02005 [Rhodobacteraceae bacterium THAF1]|uniref:Hint domain-containing protein n=1 Tax=Palleronia sp. THAF1 TaxID=2587842 RepID=UPI000F3F885D|nr:Hint domain-containing protein [Palleronia sp. THAF1]QFU08862.1 hypothetical protein FIU81_09270 [Palleronia sp. THAF1]VDC24426.1 hypothetical protein PARPLA_02005 [Rhodobacteraceae bacterium THAF1]